MKYIIGSFFIFFCACSKPPSLSPCAHELHYITNPLSSGSEALSDASAYMLSFFVGSDDLYISAKLDTGSSLLVINEESFAVSDNTRLGEKAYDFNTSSHTSLAINAIDSLQMGCVEALDTRFALTSKKEVTGNSVGLAFGDFARLPHEANNKAFFDQLVNNNNIKDIISFALCATRAPSYVLFGGINPKMLNKINNFIPIIEKTSYVVPALSLRRADNKKIIADFPIYDPKTQKGQKTILDSAAAFILVTPEMASAMAFEISSQAKELGLYDRLPKDFFRTEPASALHLSKFKSLAHLRRFPSFEITFRGDDGEIKALELSPLHYFKEMSSINPLIRAFGIRESKDTLVLGQPFLENHYIVLDRKNALVAFGDINYACTQ
jgi:hypothetical protein